MRLLPFLAASVLLATALAGCSDGNGDGTTTTRPGTTTRTGTGGTGVTTTSTTPARVNQLPVIELKVTDAAGNATPATLKGGKLTFDARGSRDTDGRLEAVAVTAKDSNTTRAGTLYSGGTFQSVTFTFDRPGIVNVTVSAIDNDGGITTNQTRVYVNDPQAGDAVIFRAFDPSGSASTCQGPTGNAILDALVWRMQKVDVLAGATYVNARVVAGTAQVAVCLPDGTAASDAGTDVTSKAGTTFPAGTDTYVSVLATEPAASAEGNSVQVDVVVGYDPPAAPAA